MDSIEVLLARMEAKLDGLIDRIDDHVLTDREFHADVETRVRKLEGWQKYMVGVAAAVGFFASNVKSFLFPN